jgi:hypothetical protein
LAAIAPAVADVEVLLSGSYKRRESCIFSPLEEYEYGFNYCTL